MYSILIPFLYNAVCLKNIRLCEWKSFLSLICWFCSELWLIMTLCTFQSKLKFTSGRSYQRVYLCSHLWWVACISHWMGFAVNVGWMAINFASASCNAGYRGFSFESTSCIAGISFRVFEQLLAREVPEYLKKNSTLVYISIQVIFCMDFF